MEHYFFDMIDKQTVKFPSIVQAGIPHNIINYSEPRWCLSIVLVRSTGERLTMKESIITQSDKNTNRKLKT